jgi:hypothetical protein
VQDQRDETSITPRPHDDGKTLPPPHVQILGNDNDVDALDTNASSEVLLTYQRAHRYDHLLPVDRNDGDEDDSRQSRLHGG